MYEATQRHVGICSKDMGINEDSRQVNAPVDRSREDIRNRNSIANAEKYDELLSSSAATKNRYGGSNELSWTGQE